MKIAVVIPAYNEAGRILTVLQRLPKVINGHELFGIVVDDGSKDETEKVAASVDGIRVLRHKTNLGKGAAAKTGCDAAYRLGADFLVLMDADGQHRPEDLERMLEPLLNQPNIHLVLGARELNRKMPLTMRLGNGFLTGTARLLFGIRVSDSQSGYRAFRREAYKLIRWAASNYAMETEMLILASHHRLPHAEVKIQTIYYDNYKGTTVFDGLRILKTLLKWKILWFRESKSLEPLSA